MYTQVCANYMYMHSIEVHKTTIAISGSMVCACQSALIR